MKIKVRSRYREVSAKTGTFFDDEGFSHEQWRRFTPPHPKAQHGEVYMTPEEAKYLVESDENRAHIEAGLEAEYSYPAGYPMPVADNLDGPLQPPMTSKSFHVSDTRQIEKATKFLTERDEAIARGKARVLAAERGDDPDEAEVPPTAEAGASEGAGARRARLKTERDAARDLART